MKLIKNISLVWGLYLIAVMTGCSMKENVKVTKLIDQVYDLGTYTQLDYDGSQNLMKWAFGNWKRGGCSAAAINTRDDKTVVGRNLDLSVSNSPVFFFRTKIEGFHETMGLSFYNFSSLLTDKNVGEKGISYETYQALPYIATDVMNKEGLYVQTNMRCGEKNKDGSSKFGYEHTNPDSDIKACSICLPLILCHKAADIDEALDYLRELDLYNLNGRKGTGIDDWNLCFMLADATGRYGLLEIACGKYYWHEKQPAQTNFYVTEELAAVQDLKCGAGRYEYIMNNLKNLRTENQLFDFMRTMPYSVSYRYDESPYDTRAEFVGNKIGKYKSISYDQIIADENQTEVTKFLEETKAKYSGKTRQELSKTGAWESVYTLTANTTDKTLRVRFFEDNSRILTFKVNE